MLWKYAIETIFSRASVKQNLHTHTHTHTRSFYCVQRSPFLFYILLTLPSPHVGMLHNISIDHVYDQLISALFSDISLPPSLSLPLPPFISYCSSKRPNKYLKSCNTRSKSSFCYKLASHTMPAQLSNLLVKAASLPSRPRSRSLLN